MFASICVPVSGVSSAFVHKVFTRAETFDFTQSTVLPFCALPFYIVCEDSKVMSRFCVILYCLCETFGMENMSQKNLK